MFARFTDRACKVMSLASQEAQRRNCEYIDTEHILLGLVKEDGVRDVLDRLGVTYAKVRSAVKKFAKPGTQMVTLARLPLTPRAKKVIEYAIEEAKTLGCNYAQTGHVLIGVLREPDGVGHHVLTGMGVTPEKVRELLQQRGWCSASLSVPVDQPEASQNEVKAAWGYNVTVSADSNTDTEPGVIVKPLSPDDMAAQIKAAGAAWGFDPQAAAERRTIKQQRDGLVRLLEGLTVPAAKIAELAGDLEMVRDIARKEKEGRERLLQQRDALVLERYKLLAQVAALQVAARPPAVSAVEKPAGPGADAT